MAQEGEDEFEMIEAAMDYVSDWGDWPANTIVAREFMAGVLAAAMAAGRAVRKR